MAAEAIRELTATLPRSLRDLVNAYVESVRPQLPSIYSEADVQRNEELDEEFLVAVGLKRLWSYVDTQYWVFHRSLELLEDHQVAAVSLGGTRYSRSSDAFREIASLRSELQELLARLELLPLVRMRRLDQLLRAVALNR